MKTTYHILIALTIFFLVAISGGCSRDKIENPGTNSSVEISSHFLKSSLAQRVDLVRLFIYQNEVLIDQRTTTVVGGEFSFGGVVLPIGDYQFLIEGVEIQPDDAQLVLYSGENEVTIGSGSNPVTIDLLPSIPMVRIAPYNMTAPESAVFTSKLEFWNIPRIRSGSFDIPYDASKLRFVSADVANDEWGILHIVAEAAENHLMLTFERVESDDEVPTRHDIIELRFSGIEASEQFLFPTILELADDEGDITDGLAIHEESELVTILGGGSGNRGLLTGYVSDATTGGNLVGATVSITGPESHETITDENGLYVFDNLLHGTYQITATLSGYISLTRTVEHNSSVTTSVFALTEQLQAGQYRIVLTWGNQPPDLDAHIWTTIDQEIYEVYYGDQGSATSVPFMLLDTDDQDGLGPETITIYDLSSPGIFAIHNYSGDPSITSSNAVIEVYSGNQKIGNYAVPTSGNGIWWYVFDISPDGQLTVHNTLSDVPPVTSDALPARRAKIAH